MFKLAFSRISIERLLTKAAISFICIEKLHTRWKSAEPSMRERALKDKTHTQLMSMPSSEVCVCVWRTTERQKIIEHYKIATNEMKTQTQSASKRALQKQQQRRKNRIRFALLIQFAFCVRCFFSSSQYIARTVLCESLHTQPACICTQRIRVLTAFTFVCLILNFSFNICKCGRTTKNGNKLFFLLFHFVCRAMRARFVAYLCGRVVDGGVVCLWCQCDGSRLATRLVV